MDTFVKDFTYALRTLRKSPGFAITALVTLALGIGASTAIFSVVNAVLLRPLPYPNADRLVFVTSDMRNRGVRDFNIAPGDMNDIKQQVPLLEHLSGVVTFPAPLSGDNADPEQVNTAFATTNFLSILGARFVLGRDFTEEDGRAPPPPPKPAPGTAPSAPPPQDVSVILSNGFWKRRYGGDPKILGRVLDLGGNHAHVVGVLQPGVEVLLPPRLGVSRVPDLYQAAQIDWATASRINVIFRCLALLKPGVTLGAARAQMDALGADLRRRFPIDSTAGVYYRIEPLRADLSADVRPALIALMGAVLFVMLIACANVANLILVRTSRRERELAVRAAFGGSRARLVRQMLVESLLLSLGGAALGLAVAKLGVSALVRIGPQDLPNIGDVGIDVWVMVFAVLAAVTAASLFGIVPALRASRPDMMSVLRQSGRMAELAGGRFLRSSVVVAEVTLAFTLLIGGGLMFRSFLTLANTDPGFDPRRMLTFNVANPAIRTPEAALAFDRALHDRLAGLPGVTAVAGGAPLPLDGRPFTARWGTDAALKDPSTFHQGSVYVVLPGFFAAMRTPILAGRDFSEADNKFTANAVIVDNLLAAKAFPGENAVGKRILARIRADTAEFVEIIGIVKHQRHESLAIEGREALYFTVGYGGFGTVGTWAVRTSGDPTALGSAVRHAVAELAPNAPVSQMQSYDVFVDQARSSTRFALVLIGSFAVIAVVLSGVGLYGVLSTAVRQRTAEIGVRMALGAPTGGIFRLVIGQGMALSLAGIGVGLIAALALTRVMRSMLVGVAPTDPLTFAAVAVSFAAIAALACWLPARRAAGVDPSVALREE